MRVISLLAMSMAAALVGTNASAQARVSDMLSNCQFEAAKRLGGDVANTSVKYEGQRVDGTHAINGSISLEGRSARFQCSYAANGFDLADFWIDASQSGSNASSGGTTAGTHTVRFPAGSTNTTMTGRLGSEEAAKYVLGANNEQFLTVSLRPDNQLTYMIIYVPGGDILYESSQAGNEYYGQLYRSGDHVVEVFYKGEPGTVGNYDVYFEID
jgi:hypothetical protein